MIRELGEHKAISQIESGLLRERPDRVTKKTGEWDMEYLQVDDKKLCSEVDKNTRELEGTQEVADATKIADALASMDQMAGSMSGKTWAEMTGASGSADPQGTNTGTGELDGPAQKHAKTAAALKDAQGRKNACALWRTRSRR